MSALYALTTGKGWLGCRGLLLESSFDGCYAVHEGLDRLGSVLVAIGVLMDRGRRVFDWN